MNKDELHAKYGWGIRQLDDVSGEVLVFAHESEEAARAYAEANIEHYGYPCTVEYRNGQWVNIIDLRPRLAEIKAGML